MVVNATYAFPKQGGGRNKAGVSGLAPKVLKYMSLSSGNFSW